MDRISFVFVADGDIVNADEAKSDWELVASKGLHLKTVLSKLAFIGDAFILANKLAHGFVMCNLASNVTPWWQIMIEYLVNLPDDINVLWWCKR